jgi:hypothetical protein
LPQDLRKIVEYCPGNEPYTSDKNGSQDFCQKLDIDLKAAASAAELQILSISIEIYDFTDLRCFSNSVFFFENNRICLYPSPVDISMACNCPVAPVGGPRPVGHQLPVGNNEELMK